ncbi:succinate dehydrogenase cytochrome b556 subunit [Candidatus Photodesmus blepharus]|uniref:Succinate dehydrogenase cytochrome b556 subunit n=1 Tax=Candidatus Photodesmus blepharonis TaxID=1179155 RepID=A0A084CN03_9GAMM|nr:succinate dehydrogenase, cytochrome b556 subunit [Candidatus Photodesmus blepharus]KEY91182.1 succinate dehydrogenase cytochrome b556 subunit [Candidatus Photodesmus blepharus]
MKRSVKEKKSRPINLNLLTMDFPITAIVSILHRISGVVMFFAIGIFLWLLSESLESDESFVEISQLMNSLLMRFILWGICTVFSYHFVAGIRHLLMDIGCFEEFERGVFSAKFTFFITALLSIFLGVFIW